MENLTNKNYLETLAQETFYFSPFLLKEELISSETQTPYQYSKSVFLKQLKKKRWLNSSSDGEYKKVTGRVQLTTKQK